MKKIIHMTIFSYFLIKAIRRVCLLRKKKKIICKKTMWKIIHMIFLSCARKKAPERTKKEIREIERQKQIARSRRNRRKNLKKKILATSREWAPGKRAQLLIFFLFLLPSVVTLFSCFFLYRFHAKSSAYDAWRRAQLLIFFSLFCSLVL